MKYKLIKEYPGSPKLGIKIIPTNEKFFENLYSIEKCKNKTSILNTVVNPENYPEFWELVVEKAKQPLFTTEDGVDIFEGDIFYFIPQNFNCKGYNNGVGSLIADKNIIAKFAEARFSTLEKAEEYILLNKPCLSLKNIADLSLKSYTTIDLGIKLIDLVKSKIQQSV